MSNFGLKLERIMHEGMFLISLRIIIFVSYEVSVACTVSVQLTLRKYHSDQVRITESQRSVDLNIPPNDTFHRILDYNLA